MNRKTFRYKLGPTAEQERQFEEVLWRCRDLYNAALEQRITAYKQCGVSVSRFDQTAEVASLRAAFPEYAAVNAQVLQQVIGRLDRAYQAFFRRVQRGDSRPGFPRFQGRSRYHSFTYPQYGKGTRIDGGFIALSRIGRVAVRWHRPVEGAIKTVTVSREVDGWYLLLSCADVPVHPLPKTGKQTGIDLGLESFATLADGTRIENPHHYRTAERRLKTAQRRLSRRKKGSKRRAKARILLAKAHLKVRRQRQDFHHKAALQLVRDYDMIYCEDLKVTNMVKNHHLAKSISEAGWSTFLSILVFKAECAGKRVELVNPAYTSQTCSGCGSVVKKGLSVRWHSCECGTELHRDHNAALNIQRVGQTHRGGAALVASLNRESAKAESHVIHEPMSPDELSIALKGVK